MAIPHRKDFLKPVLKAFADGEARSQTQIEPVVAVELKLSKEEACRLAPNSTQTDIAEKINWAVFYLYRNGLLVKANNHGLYKITEKGLKLTHSTLDINLI